MISSDLDSNELTIKLLDSSTLTVLIFYFYTKSLPPSTNLSNLSSLLRFTSFTSSSYELKALDHLRELILHAFHMGLENGKFTNINVYQAATVGNSTSLQIRSLERLMASTKVGKEKVSLVFCSDSRIRLERELTLFFFF